MFGNRGITSILSGKCNGRSIHDHLMNGRITIRGTDENNEPFQRIVMIRNGEVWDNKLQREGKNVHHIVYGAFESKQGEKGREIVHFKKGSGTGRHGKARRHEEIFGMKGVCHSWYKNGRLVRQKFIYDNKKTAYDYNAFRKTCTIRDNAGKILYEITGVLNGRMNAYFGGHSVFHKSMTDWFCDAHPFMVKKNGVIIYAGQIKNQQRVGKWVENGKIFFYERGVAIPKKLYETPPDKLDPLKILPLSNAQLRMALMAKITPERIAEIGTVIHKNREMCLYDIPKYEVRILRVQCPTTKSYYFLKVPKDSQKCEQARQWTFHVGVDFEKPIKFAVET